MGREEPRYSIRQRVFSAAASLPKRRVWRCDAVVASGPPALLPQGRELLVAAVSGLAVASCLGTWEPVVSPLWTSWQVLTGFWPVPSLCRLPLGWSDWPSLWGSRPDLTTVLAFLRNKKFLRKEYSFYPPTFHLENFNIAKPKELHNEHLSPPLTVLACEHPLSLSLSSLSPSLVFSPCLSLPFENQRHHNTLSLNSIARIS